jgi:hypothetical protein
MTVIDLKRVPEFYHNYIRQVTHENLATVLDKYTKEQTRFFKNIPADKWDYAYAPGKWTIKEMAQHIIDTERIFSYRALCIARGETVALPGFDENEYAAKSKASKRTREDLLQEFELTRRSINMLYNSFDEEQLEATGISNGNSIYVRAICFITLGHAQHHINVLNERYL